MEHPAITNLREHQEQLDIDGCMVGVSRQALDEALALHADLLEALKLAESGLDFFIAQVGDVHGTNAATLATIRAAILKAQPSQDGGQ